MTPFRKTLASLALGAVAIAITGLPTPAKADPPRWAPAYGYRTHGNTHGYYRRFQVIQPHRHRNGFRRGHGHNRRAVFIDRRYRTWSPPYSPRVSRRSFNGGLLGGVVGGGIGAFTGSHIGKGNGRTAAIIGGTILGAIIGNDIGRAGH